jgi:hypothetical protein
MWHAFIIFQNHNQDNRVFCKSHPVSGPYFTPYPLFEWGLQSKKTLLNLGMKCWSSASNARGLRVIVVVIQVWVVKIYEVAVEMQLYFQSIFQNWCSS